MIRGMGKDEPGAEGLHATSWMTWSWGNFAASTLGALLGLRVLLGSSILGTTTEAVVPGIIDGTLLALLIAIMFAAVGALAYRNLAHRGLNRRGFAMSVLRASLVTTVAVPPGVLAVMIIYIVVCM